MQTFLPYSSFIRSAEVLDNKRLGNQIKEVAQIAQTLIESGGWQNHPAVEMWYHYYDALMYYGFECYIEWRRRFLACERGGKRDHKSGEWIKNQFYAIGYSATIANPPWLGDERLHSSHRACLLAKNFEWYSQFGWDEKPTPPVDGKWPCFWPKGK